MQQLFWQLQNLSLVKNFISTNEIQWKFFPNNPQLDGSWETQLKTSNITYHVINTIRPTYKEFSTILEDIDNILSCLSK